MDRRLVADPLQSLGYGSISGTYAGIGPQFDRSSRMIYISNLTNKVLMISFDGVTDHYPIYAYTALMLTNTWNAQKSTEYLAMEASTRVYVKSVGTPTVGVVYVTIFRGESDA